MSTRGERGYRERHHDYDESWSRVVRWGPLVLLALLVVVALWNGFYTVAAHERAVLLRAGKYHATEGPGLHFKIPLVDRAVLVNTAERSMRLPGGSEVMDRGLEKDRSASQRESLILTGDLYAGLVEWNVLWRVVDPEKYLFSINARDVESTLVAVARSVMHRAVGDYSADEILTGKREAIGQSAYDEMQKVMDDYECGVSIIAVQMQRITPPERVKPAFDEVNASIQQRDQLVNEANRERNKLIPQAEATGDRLTRQAEGYAARRRAEAEGEISALLAKYRAYKEAPESTRRRLYLEAMQEVFEKSGPKTVLDGELRGLLPLLNLGEERGPSRERR